MNKSKSLLTVLFIIHLCSFGYGLDIPSNAVIIHQGDNGDNWYDVVYAYAAGDYWRYYQRKNDGISDHRVGPSTLDQFRGVLLGLKDKSGLLDSASWKVDSDGDGYSDMLELLTNGDPFSATSIPWDSRELDINGETVELTPTPDLGSDAADEPSEEEKAMLAELRRIGTCLERILEAILFGIGLALWRLVILSTSRRNIF